MLRLQNIFRQYPLPILLISLLFLIKALYLAFCVTPFSAVPDEIGHFSYTQDIAYGKGIPILSTPKIGKSLIGADIMKYVEKNSDAKPTYNWIAQHPPIYYVLAAVPLKIGTWFTNDVEILYRLPRILSALSGALLILVLFKTFRIIELDTSRSTALAAAIGFIPMVSHLSSGTSHDIPLFFFCALATYFFTRYIIQREIKDTYWCAMWLAIAGGTKMMTPWVLLMPMILIFIFELPSLNRIRHAIGILLLALSIPAAWMFRNILLFGSPLYTSGTDRKPGLNIPLKQNFIDFIQLQPVFDRTLNWFYGMFGHLGPGFANFLLQYDEAPRHLRFSVVAAEGFPYTVFLKILSILACICIVWISLVVWQVLTKKIIPNRNNSLISLISFHLENYKYRLIPLFIIFSIALLLSIFFCTKAATSLDFVSFFPIPASIFLGISAFILIFYSLNNIDKIALYGFIVTLFFGGVFLYHIYQGYLVDGEVPALQGRYFYPVIPILLLSLSVALMRMRVPATIINIFVGILACGELYTYIQQAIPLYLTFYS